MHFGNNAYQFKAERLQGCTNSFHASVHGTLTTFYARDGAEN
ncbi:hypothetical protein XAP412_430003 [Xanthomonas phaseoli pv. phaseoli]|uniref:Uncharacterized protein n=1 Tax=Xanthomonas campestris pv. phaseoli TaxID=317013 RepID=A0AB38E0W1_XANCH|nr:hypothetical protein XAP6984_480004 [Xanthomonas phaseoli pv. phaseoli]SON85514.1 hypothetical protein XAP412_430003 [Xanthomonas phaseoli pv. phaseoli]SON90146.1 hypothetical protein XAP7430_450005 [Xanthomonas phaseoli pv. phaseoli]SOO28035.1 hypothetical protein XAP6164_2090002 [Xanthomonas phaseoli pv. phaseoli]SOO29375.1 hypothetical protein XAP6164_330002 [Xanthomonas phaseoli pv. phaseoli]